MRMRKPLFVKLRIGNSFYLFQKVEILNVDTFDCLYLKQIGFLKIYLITLY